MMDMLSILAVTAMIAFCALAIQGKHVKMDYINERKKLLIREALAYDENEV